MTERQLQLLQFIRNKIVHGGMGPTYREMKDFMGVTSNRTLEDILKALMRDGYLEINRKKFRGIRLTTQGIGFDKKIITDESKTVPPTSSYAIPSNASSTVLYTPNTNGVITQANGVIPWRKGGETSGTT